MRRLFVVMCLFFQVEAWAGEMWFSGEVVLADKSVVSGTISLDFRGELVLVKSGQQVMVYPSHRIISFQYLDESSINRKFISIPTLENNFPVYHLYEIVVKGEIPVVRKPRIFKKGWGIGDFDYFVVLHDELISLRSFRKKVFPEMMKVAALPLQDYLEENRMNPSNHYDAIMIIAYFNQVI